MDIMNKLDLKNDLTIMLVIYLQNPHHSGAPKTQNMTSQISELKNISVYDENKLSWSRNYSKFTHIFTSDINPNHLPHIN